VVWGENAKCIPAVQSPAEVIIHLGTAEE